MMRGRARRFRMRSSATAGGSPLQRQRVHRLSSKPAAVSVASLRPAGGEPAVDHRLANAFALTAGLLCALAVGFVARRAPPGETVSRGLFELVVVGVPVATGLYALRSPRDARFGAMLLGAGLAWTLTALGESQDS